MRWRGAAMAVALALATVASACTDDAPSGPDDGALPDLSDDVVPIPAMEVDGMRLAGIVVTADRPLARYPTVVTEVEGTVVLVSSEPLQPPGTTYQMSFEELGEAGPELADGRPTRWRSQDLRGEDVTLLAEAEPGTLVTARARGGETTNLLELLGGVLTEVTLPVTDEGSVPGRRLGAMGMEPSDALHISYRGRGRRSTLILSEVSRDEQAALRAIVHARPSETIDPRTYASCCPPQVHEPLRELGGPRPGWVATLSPYERILVLDGDPGIALRSVSGVGIETDDLVAIARAVEAGSPEELSERREVLLGRQRDADAAAVEAREAEMGWSVVGRADFEEVAVVISAGTTSRPDLPDGQPRLCATSTAGSVTCLTAAELVPGSAEAVVHVPLVFVPTSEDAAADVEVLDRSWPMREVALDGGADLPARLFVLWLDGDALQDVDVTRVPIEIVTFDARGAEVSRTALPLP